MYRTYPFALAIYDDTLVKTVDQLHQNQKLLGLVSWLLGLSAFGVGAVVQHPAAASPQPGAEAAIHSGPGPG